MPGRFLPKLRVDYFPGVSPPVQHPLLCGFTGSAGALLVGAKEPVFFTDALTPDRQREQVLRCQHNN